MSLSVCWIVLWSAGFSVFKLKWEMDSVFELGECFWIGWVFELGWVCVREQWIVQYFECINKIFTIFIHSWVMMTLVIITNSWELCSHQWVFWSRWVLWSAGFSVFKLKWKMNGVLIDGEWMWLMECVFGNG